MNNRRLKSALLDLAVATGAILALGGIIALSSGDSDYGNKGSCYSDQKREDPFKGIPVLEEIYSVRR